MKITPQNMDDLIRLFKRFHRNKLFSITWHPNLYEFFVDYLNLVWGELPNSKKWIHYMGIKHINVKQGDYQYKLQMIRKI